MPPFCFVVFGRQFVPAGRKKRRSIEVSSGGKGKAGSRLRSLIKVTNQKNEKMRRSSRPCSGRFLESRPAPGCQMGDDPPIKPQEPPRKNVSLPRFCFRSASKAANNAQVVDDQRMQSSLLCCWRAGVLSRRALAPETSCRKNQIIVNRS